MPELTGRRTVILILFVLAFVIMIYSVISWIDLGIGVPELGWWFGEFSALFLGFAILIGIVARLGEAGISETFIDGARDMLGVALARIGYHKWLAFAWTVLVILLVLYAIVLSVGVFFPGQIF
jgi:uncharacterized ion transporter superfamily protein YfcC